MIRQPAPPPPPARGTPKVSLPGVADGAPQAIPQTAAEIQRLRSKANELSRQLSSATGRRDDVISELRSASADARPGLEARLRVLDDRIVSLEQEIAVNSRAIANSPLELVNRTEGATGGRRQGPDPDVVVPIVGMIGVFGLLPIAIGYTIRLVRRPSAPVVSSMNDARQDRRLERMEQAMDAMSIELERITEGQRFVTKLMHERAIALPPGAAPPVAVARALPALDDPTTR
jgi:hypothetical protein